VPLSPDHFGRAPRPRRCPASRLRWWAGNESPTAGSSHLALGEL